VRGGFGFSAELVRAAGTVPSRTIYSTYDLTFSEKVLAMSRFHRLFAMFVLLLIALPCLVGCPERPSKPEPKSFDELFVQAKRLPEPATQAKRLTDLGIVQWKLGARQNARDALNAATLACSEVKDNPEVQLDLYKSLAEAEQTILRQSRARDALEAAGKAQVLIKDDGAGDPIKRALGLVDLAELQAKIVNSQGEVDGVAVKTLGIQAEELTDGFEVFSNKIDVLSRLIVPYSKLTDSADLDRLLGRINAVMDSAEMERAACDAMCDVAILLSQAGKKEEANAMLDGAIAKAAAIVDIKSKAYAKVGVGAKLVTLGRTDEARTHATNAKEIAQDIPERTDIVEINKQADQIIAQCGG